MKRSFIIGAILAIFIIVLNQTFIQIALYSKKQDAYLINLAGRQRMLSQKINVEFYQVISGKMSIENLEKTVLQWQTSHQYLQKKMNEFSFNPIQLRFLAEKLDNLIPFILKTEKAINHFKNIQSINLDEIDKNQLAFLKKMDDIVILLEGVANQKIRLIIILEIVLALILILLITSQVRYVYYPQANALKKSEAILLDSENKLRAILESVGEENVLLSPDLKILAITEHAKKSMKDLFSADSKLGDDFTPFIIKGAEEKFYEGFHSALQGNSSIKEILLDFGNQKLWYQIKYLPTFDDQKNLIGVSFNAVNIDQKKQAELELQKLSIIAQKTNNGVIITNKDLEIMWVNGGFEQMSGYALAEVKGKNPRIFQGKATNPMHSSIIREKINQKIAFNQEILNYSKNGKPYWVEINITPVFDDKGEVDIFIGVQQNITDRKLNEETLSKLAISFAHLSGKAFFAAICEHIANTLQLDYVYVAQYDENNQKLSLAGEYGLGKRMDTFPYSIIGTLCENSKNGFCCYPKDIQRKFPQDTLLQDMNAEAYLGTPILTKEGNEIGVLVALHTQPIDNEEDIKKIFYAFVDRISIEMQRFEAENWLRESEERLAKTLESIPHPLLIVDNQTSIIYVNEEFEKIFGYTLLEIKEQKIDFLIPNRFRNAHLSHTQKFIENNGKRLNMGKNDYVSALTKSGEELIIKATLNTFTIKGKQYVIVILQDITEAKKRQDIILAQNKLLKDIAWQQSHKVRRPLANILGLCSLFENQEKMKEEEQNLIVSYLKQAAKELDEVIHNIVAEADKNELFDYSTL
jgi:PAS domain S-box-containing protein